MDIISKNVLEKGDIIEEVIGQISQLLGVLVSLGVSHNVCPAAGSVFTPTSAEAEMITSIIATKDAIHKSFKNTMTTFQRITAEHFILSFEYVGDENILGQKYHATVVAENTIGELDCAIVKIRLLSDNLFPILAGCIAMDDIESEMGGGVGKSELQKFIEQQLAAAEVIKLSEPIERNTADICECGALMVVVDDVSEYHCSECGYTTRIDGIIFRDEQSYSQEGIKSRHNDYTAGHHYRRWVSYIQAREIKDVPEASLAKIQAEMDREGIAPGALTCRKMRAILKSSRVGLTSLNRHVPLLVVKMGGKHPPHLSFEQDRFLEAKHGAIMDIYDSLPTRGKNVPYCPYFIYKLIDIFFKNDPEISQLKNYIHLQSDDTVKKHDRTFEAICSRADPSIGLIYTPTDIYNQSCF